MKCVLLTGACGFIGYHVAKALLKRGDIVVGVDNFNEYYDPKLKYDRLLELKKYPNFKIYKEDIVNYNNMYAIFKANKVDKICHLAAQAGVRYSIEDPFRYELTNNLGTLNMLELAAKFNVKDFVFASSSSVYGNNSNCPFSEEDDVSNPISLYAATKKNNELCTYTYHHLYKMNCTGLRFFTVIGEYGRPDMALFKFVKNILENKPIDVYAEGKLKRDFTYVGDIVDGVMAAIDNPFSYEIINLGNNNPIEVSEFINIIETTLNKKAIKNFLPMQKGDVKITYANIDKAKKLLNYQPKVSVKEAIEKFIIWYKKYYSFFT